MEKNVQTSPTLQEITAAFREVAKEIVARQTPDQMNQDELAAYLHISVPTLRKYERLGVITSKKVGRRRLYDKAQVDAAVSEGKMQ